jgi:hypothetical protein
MRILVDRFIHQELRYLPSRHAACDQGEPGQPQDQDEKRLSVPVTSGALNEAPWHLGHALGRVKVSADGRGPVSHAGTALLQELAETGLAGAVSGTLLDIYQGLPLHLPGQVFEDLAVAVADGADAATGIEVLRDRQALFGPVAPMPTAWRLLGRIDEAHLPRVRAPQLSGPVADEPSKIVLLVVRDAPSSPLSAWPRAQASRAA